MVNVILVRHGKTVGNESGKIGYTGETDKLTREGIHQSQIVGSRLQEIFQKISPRENPIIYVSESERTKQTAFHAGLIGSSGSFVVIPELNEIDMGEFLNISEGGGKRQFHDILENYDTRFPGGESVKDVQMRGLSFLKSRNPDQLHVCVTSGIVMKSVHDRIAPHIKGRPKNGSITQLRVDENGKISFVSHE